MGLAGRELEGLASSDASLRVSRALALSHTRFEPGTHKLRVRYTTFCGHLPHVHLYYSEPLLTRYTDGLPRLLVGHVHERALLDALRVQAPI